MIGVRKELDTRLVIYNSISNTTLGILYLYFSLLSSPYSYLSSYISSDSL